MLEMGEPVSIVDLAEKLIRFSGRVPGKDICIVYTGLRPAEKLVEEQSSALESTIPTSAEKIRISLVAESEPDFLIQRLSRLLGFLESGDRGNLLSTLCDLVPECVSPLRESHRPSASLPFVAAAETWTALVKAAEARRGERRRGMQRLAEAPSISLSDRREGEVCRRKTPRMGGRRQTDAAAPVATAVGCNA